jgi:hypothetical protein
MLSNRKFSLLEILWGLLSITAIGALFYKAYHYPFSFDEHHSWNILNAFQSYRESIEFLWKSETQLPLFYLVGALASGVNKFSEFFLRLPSLVFFFVSLLLFVFYWGQGKKIAGYALVAILCTPVVWREIFLFRPYALLFLGSTLASLSLVKLYDKPNKRDRVLFILGLILLFGSHYYGILFGLALVFCYYTKGLERPLSVFKRASIFTAIFWVSLVVLGQLFPEVFAPKHLYRARPTMLELAGTGRLILPDLLGGLVFIIYSFLYVKDIKLRYQKVDFFLIGSCVFTVLSALLYTFAITPIFEARYFIVLVPVITVFFMRMVAKTDVFPGAKFVGAAVAIYIVSTHILQNSPSAKRMIPFSEALKSMPPEQELVLLVRACPHVFLLRQDYSYKCYSSTGELPKGRDDLYLFVQTSQYDVPQYLIRQYHKQWEDRGEGYLLSSLKTIEHK